MICCKFFENFIQSLLIMFCPPPSPSSYQIHPHSSSTSKLCVFFEILSFKWPTKSNLLSSYISGEGHPQKCDWPTIGSRTFKANIMSLSHILLTVDSYSFKSGIPWARNLDDLILYTSWPGNHSCYSPILSRRHWFSVLLHNICLLWSFHHSSMMVPESLGNVI